jgi:SulP family sulfate permease
MSGYRHESNTELVGLGIANLVTPFFQGLPSTGVIARTSTNVRAGAHSPIAGIIHALTVLLVMLFAASLVGHVPLAALAGVLMVVCWYMAEFRHWPHILKAGRSDAFLLPVAFLLTAFVGLTEAILVGVVLAMFFFVKRMSDLTEIKQDVSTADKETQTIPSGVLVYRVRGPFFFGAATLIRGLETTTDVRFMILRLSEVPFIDATAAHSLRELAAYHRRHGGRLMLSDITERVREDLQRNHLLADIGSDMIFENYDQALALTV